jgi:hypothetical protein
MRSALFVSPTRLQKSEGEVWQDIGTIFKYKPVKIFFI